MENLEHSEESQMEERNEMEKRNKTNKRKARDAVCVLLMLCFGLDWIRERRERENWIGLEVEARAHHHASSKKKQQQQRSRMCCKSFIIIHSSTHPTKIYQLWSCIWLCMHSYKPLPKREKTDRNIETERNDRRSKKEKSINVVVFSPHPSTSYHTLMFFSF